MPHPGAIRGGATPMPVTAQQFRDALRHWASGVSVVTTPREGGVLGITVSSFCSLSLDPPLVLVCIGKEAASHARIGAGRAFAVNILRDDQRALADAAAGRSGPSGNLLEGVVWRTEKSGAPVLDESLAWLDCVLVEALPGGDHTIFVGRVEAAGQAGGRPLLWFGGDYRRLAPQRRASRR
jgi:flavin reductase (DIM6/NTAB) family NADH-FMN oxidoreductase RutF